MRDQRLVTSRDIPSFYPNDWRGVLLSHELIENQIKCFIAFGRILIAFRDKSGNVIIVEYFCLHSQSNISCEECVQRLGRELRNMGNICLKETVSNKINCWFPGVEVKVWDVLEVNQVIYVWSHSREVKPYWHFPKIADQLVLNSTTKHFLTVHIEDFIQNPSDTAHFSPIHRYIFNENSNFGKLLNKYFYIDINTNYAKSLNKFKYVIEYSSEPVLFGIKLGKVNTLTEIYGPQIVYFTIILFGIKIFVTEVAYVLNKTRFALHSVYYSKNQIIDRLLIIFTKIVFDHFLSQDTDIMNNRLYVKRPLLSKCDKDLADFRIWYKQFY